MLNITQHLCTDEQINAGVQDINPSDRSFIADLLNFTTIPSIEDVVDRARQIAAYAADQGAEQVMIGGAPFLMAPLEKALTEQNIKACYAFSVRTSIEKIIGDAVVKTSVFKHEGFILADQPNLYTLNQTVQNESNKENKEKSYRRVIL